MTTGNWKDNDGLYRQYGTSKATNDTAGEYKNYGAVREMEITIPDMTAITSSPSIVSNSYRFPSGMRLQEVQVITDTVCTGTGAVLNVGLIKDDRSTELDYNGLVAALPLTSLDAAGEQTTLKVGDSYAGALLGTDTTDAASYLTMDYDTAAFTAGAIRVRVRYYGHGTITQ